MFLRRRFVEFFFHLHSCLNRLKSLNLPLSSRLTYCRSDNKGAKRRRAPSPNASKSSTRLTCYEKCAQTLAYGAFVKRRLRRKLRPRRTSRYRDLRRRVLFHIAKRERSRVEKILIRINIEEYQPDFCRFCSICSFIWFKCFPIGGVLF